MAEYITIEGFTLFEGWQLYNHDNTLGKANTYKFNINNGELLDTNSIKVGQFNQEREEPYIYMSDSSYIRLIPKYNQMIKDSAIAILNQTRYIESKDNDL